MKTVKRLMILLPILAFLLPVLVTGCTWEDKSEVKGIIKSELDLLKNLDSETTQKYISYQALFPGAIESIELSDEIEEVFSFFSRISITKSWI